MNTMRTALLVAAVWLLIPGVDVAGGSEADEVKQALEVLKTSARAYRAVPALKDTFTYVVKGPNMDREPKKIEARLGPGTDASVADALLQAVALGRTFYVTKSDAPGKYVARPYSGDFGKTLASIVGNQSSLFEPLQIAMRCAKDPDSWVDSLRFNLLAPLRITGLSRAAGNGGTLFDEIHLTAENGHEDVRLDARTHFVSSIQLSVKPPGAPSGVFVEIRGDFAPELLKRTAGVVAFDPGARRAVPGVGDLTSESLPTGNPAPLFELETPAGRAIALADLKGRVVVLDFWATWCVPCWKTLHETQRLADWASTSGLPVTVLAVNTMEQFPTEEERKVRVTEFFKSQDFTISTLLDQDAKVFRSFGAPGLPSMVVLTPGGTIFKYHQGLFPNTLETLKEEVKKALAAEAK